MTDINEVAANLSALSFSVSGGWDTDWERIRRPWAFPDDAPYIEGLDLFPRTRRARATLHTARWRVIDAWRVLTGRAEVDDY